MEKGLLIILSGPSGVGKGTIRSFLMEDKEINLAFSVSMTTRKPRENEQDGRDYFFVSKEQFLENIKNNKFLEYAQFVDNYYGTPKDFVESLINKGRNVLLEIETNGASQVMKQETDYKKVSIFLTCKNIRELKKRIIGRNSESLDVINLRLEKAKKEFKLKKNYDYVVVNDIASRAANEIINIIKQEKLKK